MCPAHTSITIFFLPEVKLKISAFYKSIIIIFSENLPLVCTYKFDKNEIQIQPQGEPWEQHRGEVRQGTLKSNLRNFSVNIPIVLIIYSGFHEKVPSATCVQYGQIDSHHWTRVHTRYLLYEISCIFFCKKKIKSNHQENLENIV